MKRILGIIGSPRKRGNTDVLVSALLDAAAQHGAHTDRVYLGDLTIRECDGCHACWAEKPTPCPKADDMNNLYLLLAECDAVVFGTPVYWYGPTALMKAFIDRFVYFNCPANRVKIRGKAAAIVIPFEENDPAVADPTIVFFEKSLAYLEMNLVGRIIVPNVTRRGEVKDHTDRLSEAADLGRRLATTA